MDIAKYDLKPISLDKETRTVDVVALEFGVPIERFFGYVTLTANDIDLSRVSKGVVPALEHHDSFSRPVGKTVSAEVKDNLLISSITLDDSEEALFNSVEKDIISGISSGIDAEPVRQLPDIGDLPHIEAKVTSLNEISFVAKPALSNARTLTEQRKQELNLMKLDKDSESKIDIELQKLDAKAQAKKELELEQAQKQEHEDAIKALAEKYKVELSTDMTVEKAKEICLAALHEREKPKESKPVKIKPTMPVDLQTQENQSMKFDLNKALSDDGYKREWNQNTGQEPKEGGIIMPMEFAQVVSGAGNTSALVDETRIISTPITPHINSNQKVLGGVTPIQLGSGIGTFRTQDLNIAFNHGAEEDTPTPTDITFSKTSLDARQWMMSWSSSYMARVLATPDVMSILAESARVVLTEGRANTILAGAGGLAPVGMTGITRSAVAGTPEAGKVTTGVALATPGEFTDSELYNLIALAEENGAVNPTVVMASNLYHYGRTTLNEQTGSPVATWMISDNSLFRGYEVIKIVDQTVLPADTIIAGDLRDILYTNFGSPELIEDHLLNGNKVFALLGLHDLALKRPSATVIV